MKYRSGSLFSLVVNATAIPAKDPLVTTPDSTENWQKTFPVNNP
ncbi:MAG: hypothetical protein ACFFD4_15310 [Candidatus Odinarchaeota archaeon]